MQNAHVRNVSDQNLSARMCDRKTQDRTLRRFGKDREAEIHLFIMELKLQHDRFCVYFWISLKQFSSEKTDQQLTN